MGVIALGKFENKLSEAGVIGGSAKQEFLGLGLGLGLDNKSPATSQLIQFNEVLPSPPPLLTL